MAHHPYRVRLIIGIVFGFLLVAFGYEYYEYRILLKQSQNQQININDLRSTIQELEGNLSLTQYERDRLTNVLSDTEARAGVLEAQTNELTTAVVSLQKLTTIDPELLKKYSKIYFLNEHYSPPALTKIESPYTNNKDRTYEIHAQVWPHLKLLLDSAHEVGLGLRVGSAHRSFGTQETLKSSYKITYGTSVANRFSADQGYSEHQLGTTVDLTTVKTGTLTTAFEKSPEFIWLIEHAHEYGFVLSYPKNNKYYIYEPWHWRYVGISLATWLHQNNKYLYDVDQREIDDYLLTIFD